MKVNNNIIAVVLLIIFSGMQFLDLHRISHDAGGDLECKICKVASEDLDDDFLANNVLDSQKGSSIPSEMVTITYISPKVRIFARYSFFNKPPPSV